MAEITAALVKTLRERTGAGMMDCKKALKETDGDLEAAIAQMRRSGAAKAAKKAGRIAADGAIVLAGADDGSRIAMVEINSETDFVAKDEHFQAFADDVARTVLEARPADVAELADTPLASGNGTVEAARTALVAKVGENLALRRFEIVEADGGRLASYLHGRRIGVVVVLEGGDEELARDIAMHVAASRPVCVGPDDVPADLLESERGIIASQAEESGKPPEIVEKMVEGRLKKFMNEVTLEGQPFVKDPDTSVGALLSSRGAKVRRFVRFEVGEGIEKRSENFAEEVMAQVGKA